MRIAIVLVLVLGCGKSGKPEPKVTREQCNQVADHIAKLIIDYFASQPAEMWDGMSDPYETGVPKTVTKETFKAFLDSPEGKTWLLQRHGQVRSSAEAGIQPCIDTASPALVRCLLATKTREEIVACDHAHPSALSNQAPPAAPGSANAASGSSTAPGSANAAGSASAPPNPSSGSSKPQ